MSFLQPWALAVSMGVAAAVVALHFLARRRPKVVLLPTARFVPARSVRAPSRSTRPADLLLLAMRVLAVLLVGAAFARPMVLPERAHLLRVVALDVSRAALSPSAARDSAERYLRTGDVLVVFDSAARLVGGSARDSLASLNQSRAVGSL
ncbi:MAG TPA: BatA domain-containing protein, partial [Gemmatimonadaceae bacterium]